MAPSNKLYPFGFIFSTDEVNWIPSYYTKINILNTYNYSFDSHRQPAIHTDENSFIIIHGHFVHVGLSHPIASDDLAHILLEKYRYDYLEYLNILDFMGGRFAIIVGDKDKVEVYQDATGARSIYYMRNRNVISSHLHLIKDNFECIENPLAEKIPPLNISFNSSQYQNVNSLIPNFKLDFYQKEIFRFFPRKENQYLNFTEDEKIESVEFLWKEQLKHYVDNYENKKIILSLTGGNDSRVSLAMSRHLKKNIEFFTYLPAKNSFNPNNVSHKILDKDRIVVNQILSDINLNHKFIYFDEMEDNRKISREIENTVNRNAASKHSPLLLKYFIESFPQERTLHIRANLLEIGRAYFITPRRLNKAFEVYNTFYFSVRKYVNDTNKKVIDSYINNTLDYLGYSDYLYDYHLLDLYYWENRTGRWHSEVLNETDFAFETMLPFNMRAIIELSLSFDYESRKSNYLFTELINRNYPILNFYGVNTQQNLYEQNRDSKNSLSAKNKVITNFKVFNSQSDLLAQINAFNNSIYIPMELIKKNYFAHSDIVFKEEQGHASLAVQSNYISSAAKLYLEYSIYKNGELILKEDMADWNLLNTINIFNLRNKDVIRVMVTALRNTPYKSWENASRITICNYTEINSNKNTDKEVTHTSPYSITHFD